MFFEFVADAAVWSWHRLATAWDWFWLYAPGVLQFGVSAATLGALLVAWHQFRISRGQVGGRLFEFNAWRQDGQSEEDDGVLYEQCEASVRVLGPGVAHRVALHVEVSGIQIHPYRFNSQLNPRDSKPEPVARMDSDAAEVRWEFWLPVSMIENTYCVLSWVEAYGEGVRTRALRQNLHDKNVEEWRWYVGHRYRSRFRRWASQRGPEWFQRSVGRARPLGRYVQLHDESSRVGEGPFSMP